jgi:hypothetical protein
VSTFTARGGGGIYRGEWDLHRLGEVGLALGGGRAARPHRRVVPKAWAKPHQTLADRPLGPLGLGSGPLGLRVKYTLMVMIILTFGQFHFVIP